MTRPSSPSPDLVCPGCGARRGADARFCPDCHLPLVFDGAAGEPPLAVSARHDRARKVKPQLSEGDLTRVAGAANQAEGEFIQGLLLEEGVPSMLRRSAGFDVPDFLAAGPRDVMVPASGVATAREVLLQAEILDEAVPGRPVAPGPLLAGMALALALGLLVLLLLH